MADAMRIAIVEDDAAAQAVLTKGLRRYEAERGMPLELIAFSDGEDLVTGYTADYDLILMDIEMRFMDGMRAARTVRGLDGEVPIIFVTNAPQYAIEGYRVRALDYILKPISWYSFSESLDRALRSRGADRERSTVTVALKDGMTRLEVGRICYVEVQDHQLIYNTRDGRYVTKGAIRDVEGQLASEAFFRCNRCYIVNLKYVEALRGNDIMVNGDVIQVSRRQRKGFLDALNRYMNGDRR